jgi:hypothetical protein
MAGANQRRAHLTKTVCDDAQPEAKRYEIWDEKLSGFAVRVTPNGSKTFVLRYRIKGGGRGSPKKFLTIGQHGPLTAAEARTQARIKLGAVAAGRDPAEEQRKAAAAAVRKRGHLFEAVAEDFITDKASGERQAADVARSIRRVLIPLWGKRPIAEISASDGRSLIRSIKARGKLYRAHAILALCKRLWNWAIDQEEYGLETSPFDRLKPKSLIGKKKHRQRILADDEIRAFWRATGRMPYPYGTLARMLLLVGQRHREVCRARRREFHPELVALWRKGEPVDWAAVPAEWKVWSVGAARFKSDAPHMVQLSDDACALLLSLPFFQGGDYLFSTTGGKKPTEIGAKIKKKIDLRMLAALRLEARRRGLEPDDVELEGWVIHDLRRTLRTHLSALRTPDHIAEMIIGHGRKGLQRVYDQHRYAAEMREAMTAWSARLRGIVNNASINKLPVLRDIAA